MGVQSPSTEPTLCHPALLKGGPLIRQHYLFEFTEMNMVGILYRTDPIPNGNRNESRLSKTEVERILSHQIPVHILKRTVIDGHFGCMEAARDAGKEWLKYIILSLENPNVRIGMWSVIVDEIWHSYLMHTHEYFHFSREVLGVDYYHHTPAVIDEEGNSNMPQDGGMNFTRLYEERFGKLPAIWDSMPEAMACHDDGECCCY